MRRAWGLLLLGATSACFGSRVVVPPEDAAPSRDAVDATVDAKAPPEPIDCDGLARRINARPEELPEGACRHPAAACEWRNVCLGGVDSTLRCTCEPGEGGRASWRCAAAGEAPCRSWADAAMEVSRPAPVDAIGSDAEDATPPRAGCDELERMFVTEPGMRPGGSCPREGALCEWIEFCLGGRVSNITCRCLSGWTPRPLGWDCSATGHGRACGEAPDASRDAPRLGDGDSDAD